jgi:hypothetical protein
VNGRSLREAARQGGQPKPSAPYNRDPYKSLPRIRDRVTGEPVGQEWLRTYAEALRGYHRHPETKFLHGEAMDSGQTQRRHVFVETIEDIGKEADRWDDEEPLTADSEFTVSYGVSETDRSTMLAVIQSVSKRSKRRLARAAKVSTRSIPSDETAAAAMLMKEFRRLFDVASSLRGEDRERQDSDRTLVRWISEQVRKRGLTATAKMLDYDAANLAKVLPGKRALPAKLRKWDTELIANGFEMEIRVPPDH